MSRFHVRRVDKEVTDEAELRWILGSASYVTLAMSMDGDPYLVSLSHGYDGAENCLFFHCAKVGRKMDILKVNNRVWGQALLDFGRTISHGECTHLYASVHFGGRVTFLEKEEAKRHALECLARHQGTDAEALLSEVTPDRLGETVVGRVDIEFMTGKKSQEVSLQTAKHG
jgi:nitroimidazol reductase NimA-like FMN-containing flavoprotein (pyridoxamine 5'-phosphate oxidase superfamily)